MADKKLVRSEAFPGTIDRFRYLMDDLTGQYVKWWGNPNGVSLWIKEVEKKYSFCWAWGIVAYGPFVDGKRGKAIGVAGMEAEEVDGTTQIRFFDGYNPHKPTLEAPAIGPAFEEFCEMIVSEMRRWIEEHPEPARTEAGGEAAREQRKGGRPPKESHEWAREQVHLVGRDPNEVYREWHKMDNNEELADPLDSFKKAIKDPPKKGGK